MDFEGTRTIDAACGFFIFVASGADEGGREPENKRVDGLVVLFTCAWWLNARRTVQHVRRGDFGRSFARRKNAFERDQRRRRVQRVVLLVERRNIVHEEKNKNTSPRRHRTGTAVQYVVSVQTSCRRIIPL